MCVCNIAAILSLFAVILVLTKKKEIQHELATSVCPPPKQKEGVSCFIRDQVLEEGGCGKKKGALLPAEVKRGACVKRT